MKQSKSVLVTGASRGIGEAIARRFAADGFSLHLHGNRHRERLLKLAEELGATAHFADFSSDEDVLRLAEEVGYVDVLVNCAGISRYGLYQDCDDETLEELFRINLWSPMRLTRALLPGMIAKQSGVILNVSSVWGETGASMEVAYSATKAGIVGFTKALAKEVAPSGIRVNCICPGAIDTDMMASFTEEEKAEISEMIPLGRLGTAKEVAECAYFLVGDSASYITGQILSPNGGLYI